MRIDSLAFRLFASAAACALLVLPVAAFVLISLYRDAVEQGFDARLDLYLTTLIANTSSTETGAIDNNPSLGDPLFTLPLSGWYWQIKVLPLPGLPVSSSESLLDAALTLPSELGVAPDKNLIRRTDIVGPEGQSLKVVEREIKFGVGDTPVRYSFVVAGDRVEIEHSVADFSAKLVIALTVLGLGLVVATLFQVRFGLRPMRAVGEGLAAIRSGESEKLEGDLPAEIEPLQIELNALIQSNRDIVERARTHVGNLAHALKTPLSVIANEARNNESALAAKVAEQAEIMRDQISHHLDRARMAARSDVVDSVSAMQPIVQSIARTLRRIYQDKNLKIEVVCGSEIKFRGETQDLEEMIGNLMDNACKWAKSKVRVEVVSHSLNTNKSGEFMCVHIDDDGPGLSAAERDMAVKRGRRLDESKPGSGLGLSIVADLAHLYKGELVLLDAPIGGLRAELNLPQASLT